MVSTSTTPHRAASDIVERLPPAHLDAEKSVLGSILLDPECFDDVAMLLRAEDFYDDANQIIFDHMLKLVAAGKRIDPVLLMTSLKKAGQVETIGGVPYLAELQNIVPHAASVLWYAGHVSDSAKLRGVLMASTDSIREVYDHNLEPNEIVSKAESRLFAISERSISVNAKPIADVLVEAMARLDKRMSGDCKLGGVPTGLVDLDKILGGLHDSELTILAARPSMGKTALALNIAEHAAITNEMSTLFVSLEMSAIELGDRLLCSVARVNGQHMRDGSVSQEEKRKLATSSAEMTNAPLLVDDTPGRTMTEISAVARRMKRREGLRLVVIDYLQLIEPEDKRAPRQEQVATIARRLKRLARELNVPVLCLAQLNRQAEAAGNNRPRLSHLRESGAIEQDADVVMFVHREEYYQTTEEARAKVAGEAEIMVAKQRNGPTGDVKLVWLHKFTRFENAAPPPVEEHANYNSAIGNWNHDANDDNPRFGGPRF